MSHRNSPHPKKSGSSDKLIRLTLIELEKNTGRIFEESFSCEYEITFPYILKQRVTRQSMEECGFDVAAFLLSVETHNIAVRLTDRLDQERQEKDKDKESNHG